MTYVPLYTNTKKFRHMIDDRFTMRAGDNTFWNYIINEDDEEDSEENNRFIRKYDEVVPFQSWNYLNTWIHKVI